MRDIFEYKDNFAIYSNVKSELKVGDLDKCPTPIISVIMPVFKRPAYFKIALDSVLNQDFEGPYEIVVVDNNSDEGDINQNQQIVEEANSNKIFYYRNEKNIGMFGNWNRGIELSRANYVTYCHDDDMFLPNTLSTLYKIQGGKDNKAVFGTFNKIDPAGNYISVAPVPHTKFKILKPLISYNYSKLDVFMGSPGFGCGCLFKRDKLIEIGGYSEEFYPSADYALNAVYTVKYGSRYTRIPTFNYRIAENESLSVYERFVDVDKYFRDCMKQFLPYPNFILDRIIKANYRISKIKFAINWGKRDESLLAQRKVSDRLILSSLGRLRQLRKYRIGF